MKAKSATKTRRHKKRQKFIAENAERKRIQDTEYRTQDTGDRIQETEYRIQDTEYRIQETGKTWPQVHEKKTKD